MRSEIAIASLLLDYINETSHTNNPGPSHLSCRWQTAELCGCWGFFNLLCPLRLTAVCHRRAWCLQAIACCNENRCLFDDRVNVCHRLTKKVQRVSFACHSDCLCLSKSIGCRKWITPSQCMEMQDCRNDGVVLSGSFLNIDARTAMNWWRHRHGRLELFPWKEIHQQRKHISVITKDANSWFSVFLSQMDGLLCNNEVCFFLVCGNI